MSGIWKDRERLTGKSTFQGNGAVARIKAPKWEQAYNHALQVRSLQIYTGSGLSEEAEYKFGRRLQLDLKALEFGFYPVRQQFIIFFIS